MRLRDEKRTIMLVSHSTVSVRSLYDQAIWLDQGMVRMDGAVAIVVEAYEKELSLPISAGASAL